MSRFFTALRQRLADARPPLRLAIPGGVFWGVAMGASALWSTHSRVWGTPQRELLLTTIFALGGLLAFVPALMLFNLLTREKAATQKMAVAFLSLLFTTLAVTAAIFALHFRAYYSLWYDDAFTFYWFVEQFFTTASAFYQFAVLGIRLYLPFGLIALFGASYYLAKKPV